MGRALKNAIIGQSGGPTCVINSSLFGVISEVISSRDKIDCLYGMRNGIEGFLREDFVNLFSFCGIDTLSPEMAIKNVEPLTNTPGAFLGSCRYRLSDPSQNSEDYEKIVKILEKYNIGYFFYIGGNDSMDTVAKLYEYTRTHMPELKVIGIPKTIDNDLSMTDHTPGYGSCAKYIATTIAEIARDRESYHAPTVTLVEIMGRETGWLTASSALGGADLIYLPERAFSPERFVLDVRRALEKKNSVIVALSEGLRYENGVYLSETTESDAFGNRQLLGASRTLLKLVQGKAKCKARVVELSLSQRCASHLASSTDINESIAVGKTAVKYALSGENGKMVAIERRQDEPYKMETCAVPACKVANQIKYLPSNYINSEGNFVTEEFLKYVKPLVMGEHYPKYENGVPVHCVLNRGK